MFKAKKKFKGKFEIKNSEIIVQGSTGISEYTLEALWSSLNSKCSKIEKNNSWKKAKSFPISQAIKRETKEDGADFTEVTIDLFKNLR